MMNMYKANVYHSVWLQKLSRVLFFVRKVFQHFYT